MVASASASVMCTATKNLYFSHRNSVEKSRILSLNHLQPLDP